jgi:Fasciclin domain
MKLHVSKASKIVKTTIVAWALLVTSGSLARAQEFGRSVRRADDSPILPRSRTGSKTHVRYSINTDHMENDGEEIMTMLRELQDQVDSFGPPSDMPSDIPSVIPVPSDSPSLIPATGTMLEVIQSVPELSSFLGLVEIAGATSMLSDSSETVTVFGATDTSLVFELGGDAFDTLIGNLTLLELFEKEEYQLHVADFILFQIVPDKVFDSFSDGLRISMGNGEDVQVKVDGAITTIINREGNPSIPGDEYSGSNGILHVLQEGTDVIYGTLFPGFFYLGAGVLGNDYSIFTSLLEASSVQVLLEVNFGPWTVLAPNDAAFNDLPQQLLDTLSAPENLEALQSVLYNHLIVKVDANEYAAYPSPLLSDGLVLESLEELPITVTVSAAGVVQFNGATVVEPDMLSIDGITHGINAVLLPPSIDRFSGRKLTKAEPKKIESTLGKRYLPR